LVIDVSADVSLTWAGITFSSTLVTPIYLNDTVIARFIFFP